MRRFDIPAAPSVAGGRGDLLRLVDPRGLAVAWLDPQAGRCVGYAVRPVEVTVGGWRELLGGAIAVGWPWSGEAPPDSAGRWRLIERDPTAATLVCRCECVSDLALADLALSASLDDGALRLRLVARATTASDFRAQLRLVAPGAISDQRTPVIPITTVERSETIVLKRAEWSWRLLVTPEPECSVVRVVEGDGGGVIVTATSSPHHVETDRENTCVLTMMIMPLG